MKKKKVSISDIISKIRRVWFMNPKTRIKESKKIYDRKKEKGKEE